MAVAELDQFTASLAAVDVAQCDDVVALVRGFEFVRNMLHARSREALARLGETGGRAPDGAVDWPAWVALHSGGVPRELRARARVSLRLRQLPAASVAARAGELQPRHQQLLADCVQAFPGLALRDDELLTEFARTLDLKGFETAIRVWRDRAADDRDDRDDRDPAICRPILRCWNRIRCGCPRVLPAGGR